MTMSKYLLTAALWTWLWPGSAFGQAPPPGHLVDFAQGPLPMIDRSPVHTSEHVQTLIRTGGVPSCRYPTAEEDGCAGAPPGSYDIPDFLTGYLGVSYPVDVPWNKVGIDYQVGAASGEDPATARLPDTCKFIDRGRDAWSLIRCEPDKQIGYYFTIESPVFENLELGPIGDHACTKIDLNRNAADTRNIAAAGDVVIRNNHLVASHDYPGCRPDGPIFTGGTALNGQRFNIYAIGNFVDMQDERWKTGVIPFVFNTGGDHVYKFNAAVNTGCRVVHDSLSNAMSVETVDFSHNFMPQLAIGCPSPNADHVQAIDIIAKNFAVLHNFRQEYNVAAITTTAGNVTGLFTPMCQFDCYVEHTFVNHNVGINRARRPAAGSIIALLHNWSMGYSAKDKSGVVEIRKNYLDPSFVSSGAIICSGAPDPFWGDRNGAPFPLAVTSGSSDGHQVTLSFGQLKRPIPSLADTAPDGGSYGANVVVNGDPNAQPAIVKTSTPTSITYDSPTPYANGWTIAVAPFGAPPLVEGNVNLLTGEPLTFVQGNGRCAFYPAARQRSRSQARSH
jgi:hypothetical protein